MSFCTLADGAVSLNQRCCSAGQRAFLVALPLLYAVMTGCATPSAPVTEPTQSSAPAVSHPCAASSDNPVCQRFNGTIENVDFGPGEHALGRAARAALDLLVSDLKKYPSVVIAIGGHTDNRGNARTNLALSKKRVMSVVRYLVVHDIDGRRLRPHGYGESRPVVSNATPEGRARNRRIELNIVNAENASG